MITIDGADPKERLAARIALDTPLTVSEVQALIAIVWEQFPDIHETQRILGAVLREKQPKLKTTLMTELIAQTRIEIGRRR